MKYFNLFSGLRSASLSVSGLAAPQLTPLLLTFLLVDVINTFVEKVEPLLLLIVYIGVTPTVPGSLMFLEDIIST